MKQLPNTGLILEPGQALWWFLSHLVYHMHLNLSDILGAGQKPSFHSSPMGSMLGNLPSFDAHNFSQLRPSDPSNPYKMVPSTYCPTHSRTLPPPDQVIATEAKNILVRNIYQRAEEKLRSKRAATEHIIPEHGCKQPRPSTS